MESTRAGRRNSVVAGAALVAAAWALGACATLEEMSVAQTRRLAEGEFHAAVSAEAPSSAQPVLLLPATLDPELATTLGYRGREAEFAPLLEAVNADLGTRSCCRYLAGPGLPAGAPHVYVGIATGELAPPEGREQLLPTDRSPPMILHLREPAAAWSQAMAELLAREDFRYAVVPMLTVSQFPKGRAGAFGKNVVLGTGHEQHVRFLTGENVPLEVLALTGVMVDAQGRVVRAGAEGILARDTPFAAQALGAEKVLSDDTLAGAASATRRDLPGDPPSWQVALDNLLAQLRGDRAGLRVP